MFAAALVLLLLLLLAEHLLHLPRHPQCCRVLLETKQQPLQMQAAGEQGGVREMPVMRMRRQVLGPWARAMPRSPGYLQLVEQGLQISILPPVAAAKLSCLSS
jgi:hypothetical protein